MTDRRRYVYRLVVESWPTADGQPFVDQDDEFWEAIAACARGGHESECRCPVWLPPLAALRPYLAHPATYDCPAEVIAPPRYTRVLTVCYEPYEPENGYRGCAGTQVMALPIAQTRRFMQRANPAAMAEQLRAWGCRAYVERAEVGPWERVHA